MTTSNNLFLSLPQLLYGCVLIGIHELRACKAKWRFISEAALIGGCTLLMGALIDRVGYGRFCSFFLAVKPDMRPFLLTIRECTLLLLTIMMYILPASSLVCTTQNSSSSCAMCPSQLVIKKCRDWRDILASRTTCFRKP